MITASDTRNIVGIKIKAVERHNHIDNTNKVWVPEWNCWDGEVSSAVHIRVEYEILSADGGEKQNATITYRIIEHGSTDISSGTIVFVPGEITWEGHADGTLTRNGEPVTENAEDVACVYQDRALCAVLSRVFGDEFTGYAHNYEFQEGNAIYRS